ncbi:MAG: DUF6191 domain-containing protein [Pseudonocardia sp.]|nr:DUF6191 domain-containing protein [Pseudonocardia sp.]
MAGQIWALSSAFVVCGLMALVVLDRVGVAVSGRSWLPWRRHRRTQAALGSGMDQVVALFYATKHHELDQRRAEYLLRDESDDGAPRRFTLGPERERPTIVVPSTDPEHRI